MGIFEIIDSFEIEGSGSGFEIALSIVGISIVFAGIVLGLGYAFNSKRMKNLGKEEILQSFINAALLGAFGLIVAMLTTVSYDLLPTNATATCLSGSDMLGWYRPISSSYSNENLTLASYSECLIQNVETGSFTFTDELSKSIDTLSFASDIELHTGIVDYKPFSGLSHISKALSSTINRTTLYQSLLTANALLLRFSYLTALTVFLPLGLIFRSFFVTRKVGGLLIAIAIGLYIIYPLINVVAMRSDVDELYSSINDITNFTSKYYENLTFYDLSTPGSVSSFSNMTSMTQYRKDLVESTYHLTGAAANVEGSLFYMSVILPIISLFITIVTIIQLTKVLGAEFITTPIEII